MTHFCNDDRDAKQLTGADLEIQIAYWQAQLADAPPRLELPTDRARSLTSTFQLAQRSTVLAAPLVTSLQSLSQQAGCSLATTVLAAFNTFLHRYSGQEDILVGMPIVTNPTEFDRCSCVNTLVVRTQVVGNLTVRELLARVERNKLAAEQHQDLPIEVVLKALDLEPSLGHLPLSQVMFEWGDLPNVKVEFELLLSIVETDAGWEAVWSYNRALFDASTIERMAAHFQILLAGIVANPERKLERLPLLSSTDREQLLLSWNNTQTQSRLDRCCSQLFEDQVLKTPDAIAVVCEDCQLTYHQLNDRANRWAHQLVERGVEAETLVALLGDRNIDFLTAMLAIFKAGGAYLPLNPQHPIERIHQVLAQSQAPLILCASQYQALADNSRQLLVLEDLDKVESSSDNLPVRCTPDNLAYVIFTSGSTGKPKGAMLEQRGMLNHLFAKVTDLQLTSADVVAQTASQTFDISIWQFLVALVVGGRVEIVQQDIAVDPARLIELVDSQQVSILEIVPSLLRMMLVNLTPQPPSLGGKGGPELEPTALLFPSGFLLLPSVSEGLGEVLTLQITQKPMTTTEFLVLDHASKVYPTATGEYTVLDNVNLTVAQGEFICIIGHSGCGKSTLLNMVSGFSQPSSGEVRLNGKPIGKPGPDRMVVFQGYALLPWLTAYENIYLAVNSVNPDMPKNAKDEIVRSHLAMVGLTEAADKLPGQISGGMKQRVAIARALSIRPEVLILDEPFGALDAITKEELQEELLKIWNQNRCTVLMITHDIDEALFLADKLVMMTNGPAANIGEVLTIPFSRPRDRARMMEMPEYYQVRNYALDFLYNRYAHDDE